MGVSYLQMGRKLWGEPAIGEDTPNLARNRKSKQKVIKENKNAWLLIESSMTRLFFKELLTIIY